MAHIIKNSYNKEEKIVLKIMSNFCLLPLCFQKDQNASASRLKYHIFVPDISNLIHLLHNTSKIKGQISSKSNLINPT